MIDRSIGLRYARALFTLDLSNDRFKTRLNDFNYFLEILKSNPLLMKLFLSPTMTIEEKELILKKCFPEIKEKIFLHFLFYLIKKKRLKSLKSIYLEYKNMCDVQEGIWEAQLLTAKPIDEPLMKKIKIKLENFYNKKFVITEIIDPKMIGGMLIKVGNHIIDWSIANRLEKLEDSLLSAEI
jgi:F-type H+-transporting ATPase subunit delta